MATTAWPFIEIDESGVAVVAGTRTKVIEVALDRIAHRWDADEIHRQYTYLSLSQIHAALGFYYDNQTECDQLIEDRRRSAEQMRTATENPQLQQRLRELARP